MPSSSPTEIERARWLTKQLDGRYIDPLLGLLVPGLGDFVSSGLGAYLVYAGWKGGASRILLARMLANLAIDAGLGSIPLVGDLFDFVFRANQKNLELLERPSEAAAANSWRDAAFLVGAALLFVVALALPILAFIAFLGWVF